MKRDKISFNIGFKTYIELVFDRPTLWELDRFQTDPKLGDVFDLALDEVFDCVIHLLISYLLILIRFNLLFVLNRIIGLGCCLLHWNHIVIGVATLVLGGAISLLRGLTHVLIYII